MKKMLLLFIVLGISFSSFAQKKKSFPADKADHPVKLDYSFTKVNGENVPIALDFKSENEVLIERRDLGISANVFSVLLSYQRCLSYDEATNTLLGTYRADPATYPGADESGTVMAHVSNDGGSTWNHMVHLNPSADEHALRYPSGVLYNHNGSSNPDDLYAVVAGPAHTGAEWNHSYYGSKKLTDENESVLYNDFENSNEWDVYSMTTVPGGAYIFGREYDNAGNNQGVNQTIRQLVGTTDDPADGFDWDLNTVTPDWYVGSDGVALALYNAWSAWSRDGSIGYAWMVGVSEDSEEYGGYQPQVYFTEDGGDSWDEIELNMEDHPSLVEFLPPWEDENGNAGTVKPTMGISEGGSRNFPGVVDYEGRLHIFAPIFGMSTESAADPESGYWNVGDVLGGHIFDIVLDQEGLQDLIFVDSVMSKKTPTDYWGGDPAVDWDHRLQASKSLDEKVVFAVWADDETSEEFIDNPDIIGWAYNTETKVMSEPVNFTEDDLYTGFFFFHFVSELTPLVDGNYEIPVAITLSPTEFASNSSIAPCTHYYLDGISFPEVVGIEEDVTTSVKNISVSQNQPNPFVGTTTIEINSNTADPALIEVMNIMGQTVYSMNAGMVNGSQRIELNVSDLKSGVYFYTVTIGNESVSKKMIIE